MKNKITKFWNIAVTGEDTGEITLYGDVVDRQPIDWWTGEPDTGLYIAPESFLQDLEAVKDKSFLTVKINSCGGDLYTGIAIHNALKGLAAKKTVIVDGIAASAASVIACAGDDVQVYPGSIIMIHGVSGLLADFYTLKDLRQLEKNFDASERAIAQIYHEKTGLAIDHLRNMMNRETWMVGQEAVDNGFADTLLQDEPIDMAISADKKVLLVAGIRHAVSEFKNIPESIRVENIQTAPKAGNKKENKNGKDETPMNIDELRAKNPDLLDEIIKQAKKDERERIEAIDSIAAGIRDSDLVNAAKYGADMCTAEQLALKALQKQSALCRNHLENMRADAAASGSAEIGVKPNGGTAKDDNALDDQQQIDRIVETYNKIKNGVKK